MRGQAQAGDILYGEIGPRDSKDPFSSSRMVIIDDGLHGSKDEHGKVTMVRLEGGVFPLLEQDPIDRPCTIHVLDGEPHREDGPAVEYDNGDQEWYLHGLLHREDGPAITTAAGDQYYYQHGQLHRDPEADGSIEPAVIETCNGLEEWRRHGLLHRDGAPAVISDAQQRWYRNGCLHREDGPAIQPVPGRSLRSEEYYLDDELFDTREEWEQKKALLRQTVKTLKTDAAGLPTLLRIEAGGRYQMGFDFRIEAPCLIHLRDGVPHRDDGPAVEYDNGSELWMRAGKNHRDPDPSGKELPALINIDEGADKDNWTMRSYWRDGLQHREDGLAVEYWDGTGKWMYKGQQCADEEALRERIRKAEIAAANPRPWWEQDE